jgi:resuscitation-promoting factor RpfC
MQSIRRFFATAALTGAVAVALLAITGMSELSAARAKADSVNWDAIAQCESGGNWSTNTGNGYYGGLQFSPAHASRAEQIRVAENVLATQGIKAWPTCGGKGGSTFSTIGVPSIPSAPQWRPGTYIRNTINEIIGLIPRVR